MTPEQTTTDSGAAEPEARPRRKLMRYSERRRQITGAAKGAFARTGFAGTSLEDVAEAAGISKTMLYRHFVSKTELYQAVLDEVAEGLAEAVGGVRDLREESIDALVAAAGADPDGFRLLFEHAAREPEFRGQFDRIRSHAVALTGERMPLKLGADSANVAWGSMLIPTLVIDAVLTWLAAGQPDPERAGGTVRRILTAVTEALREPGG